MRSELPPVIDDVGLLEDSDLWSRRDEPNIKMELVSRHMAFARSIAIRYRGKAESFEDLVQVASLGLVLSVDRFDPGKGIPFVAFASPTIHGELKRHFRDRVSNVRLPRAIYERIGQIERAIKDLRSSLNHEPTTGEIARVIGCEEQQIEEARLAAGNRNPVPIVNDRQEDDSNEERIGHTDDGFDAVENKILAQTAIAELDQDDRHLVLLRFRDELTQTEIAERIGCSQMHVSRRLRSVLDEMSNMTSAA